MTLSGCQNFAPRTAPTSPSVDAPPTTPMSSRSATSTLHERPPSSARAPLLLPVHCHRRPRGPHPFSPWTAAVIRGRPADLLPERRRPSSRSRMTSSTPPVASPSTAHEPPPPTAPQPPFATNASSSQRAPSPPLISSARIEIGDGADGAATTAPREEARFVFSFSKCNYM
jgi:hypothetical protein